MVSVSLEISLGVPTFPGPSARFLSGGSMSFPLLFLPHLLDPRLVALDYYHAVQLGAGERLVRARWLRLGLWKSAWSPITPDVV